MITTRRTARASSVGAIALAAACLLGACSSSSQQASTGGTTPPSTTATGGATTGTNGAAGTNGTTGTSAVAAPITRTTTGPVPTVTGPITGGTVNSAAPAKLLADAGYVEEEYFLAGDATSYTPVGTWAQDGRWEVSPGPTAPYVTRVLVRRPSSPAKFNGTVLVEWLNVTAGADVAVDFGYTNKELTDQGYIYVGVTAQKVGNDAAKGSDPTRYAPLTHPGDQFSYDMFTQAGRAVLANKVFAPTFAVQKILADGESQSAARMTTYINAVQKPADVYDAFLVHSRSDRSTPVAADQSAIEPGAHIRTDLRSPTLVVLTETDVLGNVKSQQDDTDTFRRWELAGTAHVDNYNLAVLAGEDPTKPSGFSKACDKPLNTAHEYWLMNAGLRHLAAWVNGGPPPPKGDRMALSADQTAYVVDEHGNATGGIRLPDVDVPIATLTGLGNTPNGFCRLFGTTTAFDAATLAKLYPDHAAYVKAYEAATDKQRAAGFLLDRDVADAKAYAAAAPVPS